MRAEVVRTRRAEVVRDDLFVRDGLHLTAKGAAVLGREFVIVVNEGTGTVNYFNKMRRGN